ncbi:hypothetical protein EON63_18290, partial [archaeon]
HTPYTIHHIPYTIHHIPYTIHHIPYTIYHIPYTIYHIPYTIYQIPYNIYHTPYTKYDVSYIFKDELLSMIKREGFSCCSYVNFTFGVVAVHTGFKLPSRAQTNFSSSTPHAS